MKTAFPFSTHSAESGPITGLWRAVLLSILLLRLPAMGADLDGLIGYWTFQEGAGTNTADLTANGLNGTFDNVATWGGPAWTNSPFGGSALNFDGVNDRITIGNPPALQMTGPMTLTAWVYVRTFSKNGRIITKGGASGQRSWALNVESGTTPPNTGSLQIGATASTTFSVRTIDAIPAHQWIHLAGVYIPGQAMRIYTNGFLNNEVTADVPATQNNSSLNVTIGARPSGSPDTPWDGLIDEVRVFNRALTGEEIQALPELVQTPLTFARQPASQTVVELRPVTFTAAVQGPPPYFIQWYENGVPIFDANRFEYTIPSATLDLDGRQYSVTVSNLAYGVSSTNATLRVSTDTQPPTVLSAGSGTGMSVDICFNEPLDPNSAYNFNFYEVNGGATAVVGVTLREDGASVKLDVWPYLTPGPVTVKVTSVQDLLGNPMAAVTVTGTVAGLTSLDLGFPFAPGSSFSCRPDDFDVTAGGSAIWGTADNGHFVYREAPGDFDVNVRVASLTPVNSTAQAGLMVRETADAGSPALHLLANPPPPGGRGYVEAGWRSTAGGSTANWGTTYTTAVLPDVWVRLRRWGDLFSGFYSTNGLDWVWMGQAAQAFANPVLLGMAASAHSDTSLPTLAQFRGFTNTVFSNATLAITQQPANTSAPQNANATFAATAQGAGAAPSDMAFQWQRDNGSGLFVDIPGANLAAYTFQAKPEDNNARFRLRVHFAGLTQESEIATLTVTEEKTPPTVDWIRARGIPTRVVLAFSEAVTADSATALGNYAIVGPGGAGVPVLAAALGTDARTVTLTTDPMTDGTAYTLVVNGVQDLAVPPNSVVPNTQAPFDYSSLIGHWRFEEGTGLNTADASGGGFNGTLVNGPVWAPGLEGRYAIEFDGADDRVDIGNPVEMRLTGPMTLAAWVWVDTISGNGRIVTKGGGSGQRCWSLNVEGTDNWALQVASSGTANVSLLVPGILTGQWIHVAGVYDPADIAGPIMRFYTNGALAGELLDGVPAEQHNSSLGVAIGNRSVSGTPFDGKIDDVRIYARALSGAEIAVLAAPPATPAEFLPPVRIDNQITLDWTGSGQLEWAPAVDGQWTPVTPAPAPPYSVDIVPGENRFFRIRTP